MNDLPSLCLRNTFHTAPNVTVEIVQPKDMKACLSLSRLATFKPFTDALTHTVKVLMAAPIGFSEAF